MAIYSIRWKPSAVRDLKKLDRPAIPRIVKAVEALSSDPFPAGARKMQRGEHCYRIRVGDYRVIYSVLESRLLVEVVRARHRKDAYRG